MQTGAWLGQKTAPPFMATPSPRIKPSQALGDCPFDGGVIANLEMEVIQLHLTAPITAP